MWFLGFRPGCHLEPQKTPPYGFFRYFLVFDGIWDHFRQKTREIFLGVPLRDF